jgi:hypothetical protein
MSKPINLSYISKFINPDSSEYLFELTIYLNDENNSYKKFKKITTNKFVKLVDFTDEIEFKQIDRFDIKVKNIISSQNYLFENTFINTNDTSISEESSEDNIEENFKTFKNEDMYIEFEKNKNNLTQTICYLTAIDNNRIFVTPPNY